MIRAKYVVVSVEHHFDNDGGKKGAETVKLRPVYSSDPTSENHAFWTATPYSSVELTINNPATFGAFVGGREYYVDFTPAG